MASADEGVIIPGSEASSMASADGGSEEGTHLSETYSDIYYHGYKWARRALPCCHGTACIALQWRLPQ
jgi:hypothetical protein